MTSSASQTAVADVLDVRPEEHEVLDEVIAGLTAQQKTLPSKYFYDERGCGLFEAICKLPEYYLTRTELAIMRAHASEMALLLGRQLLLVELGSGASIKTRLLLDRLRDVAAYVPVDISRSYLEESRAMLAEAYPRLRVLPVCADFTQPFELPEAQRSAASTVFYLPGSTLGNFEPSAAQRLLRQITAMAGSGGGLLIGLDLKKDQSTLESAYNDSAGVTAEFNLNLLHRLNREHCANFDTDAFVHRAYFNNRHGRIEMHLESTVDQQVRLGSETIEISEGETIHTENSYKYDLDQFGDWAADAGMQVQQCWSDKNDRFSVLYLRVN